MSILAVDSHSKNIENTKDETSCRRGHDVEFKWSLSFSYDLLV